MNAIEIRSVEKSFDARRVLRGVSLGIPAGERVALVGPNGSGKTTLMRCILGFVRAGGSVRVGGADPWTEHAAALRQIAYVPQRAPALAAPVGELARAWAALRGCAAERLGEVADRFGMDLESLRGVPFVTLSGGMQQKLLSAMAFASEASVLLFDEPTANLDPAARRVFLELFAARPGNPTVLLSSHRLEELRDLVDRVVVLEDGAIAFDDRLATFLAQPELAAAAGMVDRGHVVPFRRSP